MAGTGLTIVRRIRSLLGSEAAVETDHTGLPRVAPDTEEGVALVLRTAAAEGWRVRVEGATSWMPPDAPGELALSARALCGITQLTPPDLVATVWAGTRWDELRAALAEHGAWTAADPPGHDRTVGSVVATATAGPLRAGFGPIRDHLLGVTFITGEGRIVHAGGRVVKNVAGFDLTKLVAGSFGAFGVITSVTLRLRAVPRSDLTLIGRGPRDELLHAACLILEAGITPAALEVTSPTAAGSDGDWMMAIRLVGAHAETEADRDVIAGAAGLTLRELDAEEAAACWQRLAAGATAGPVTLRLGTLPTALDEALDLAEHHLPEAWVSVTVPAGTIRWSGDAPPERLRLLRHAAAQQETPLTLERAPWAVRGTLGHFGAYREGVGRLVEALRQTFDPTGLLVTGVGAAE